MIDLRDVDSSNKLPFLCDKYGMEYFHYPVNNHAKQVESMVALMPQFCEMIDKGDFYIACAMGLHRTDIALCTYWVFYAADKGIAPPPIRGYRQEDGHNTSKIMYVLNSIYKYMTEKNGVEPIPKEDLKLVTDKAQQVQAGNGAGILRRGEKQGGCTVVFSNQAGERFEAAWSVRVKRTGTYDSPERTLRQLAPKKEKVERNELQARMEQAIGLNYEQFTRTVILAQNSFANFLKAKAADKAVLLEKLTGTEVYGTISQRIYAHTTQAEAEANALQARMEGLLHDKLDDEALAAERERSQRLTASKLSEEQTLSRLARQQEWLARFFTASQRVAECEAAFATATKQWAEMRADGQQLERYDSLLALQPLYQEIVMRRADMDRAKATEAANVEALERVKRQLDTQTSRLDVAAERTAFT